METKQTYKVIGWDESTRNYVASNDGETWEVISAETFAAICSDGRNTTNEESAAWDFLNNNGSEK